MKKTNLVVATIFASVVGFGSGAAMAQGGGDGERSWKHHSGKHYGAKRHGKRGGKHGMRMMKRMAKKLGLTDDQKAKIKEMREAQKAENQGLREAMKTLRAQMQNLDPTDAGAVAAMAAEKGRIAEEKFKAKNAARLAFEAILTDEQKEKLAEMKAKRKARMEERKQKRMERKAARNAS